MEKYRFVFVWFYGIIMGEKHLMDLFLWRHADALSGMADFDRELSTQGHQQAARAAEWLEEHAPEKLRILVSPSVRTRQTVGYFNQGYNTIEYLPPLYDNRPIKEILALLDWPDMKAPTLVVGHQPQIGELADFLLGKVPHPYSFNKCAIWWLRAEAGQKGVQLEQVVEP